MTMVSHEPTSAEVILEIQSWINDLGIRAAFKIAGKLLLYSGPRATIFAAYPDLDRNHDRACTRAASKKYGVIDQTEVGLRLNSYAGTNIYFHFRKIYDNKTDAD